MNNESAKMMRAVAFDALCTMCDDLLTGKRSAEQIAQQVQLWGTFHAEACRHLFSQKYEPDADGNQPLPTERQGG